jgi:hyaluronan synthase
MISLFLNTLIKTNRLHRYKETCSGLLNQKLVLFRVDLVLTLVQQAKKGKKTETVSPTYSEVDRKRWLVRYLILAGIGIVLAIKLYLLLVVVDLTVGIYSFFTSFILFNILLISYTKFKDPYINSMYILTSTKDSNDDDKPLVSIIVPVKNEEGNIRNCVQSCINSTYSNKEIIIVDDGSTDGTAEILDQIKKEEISLNIIHLSKSVGKKQAIEAASEIAKGEIYVSMDSDCDMADDAVEKAVKIFQSDRKIGAITGHGRVRGADTGNILLKMQDVYIDASCRILKGMETSFCSVTCCAGALSFFRTEAVKPYIHKWAHDKFLRIENFKFATDRRLTAYVLGVKPVDENGYTSSSEESNVNNNNHIHLDSTNNIPTLIEAKKVDTESSSYTQIEDSKNKKNLRYRWKIVYSPSVKVNVGVPETFPTLIRQQIRWRKSFIRSLFATGEIYWRRPFYAALLYYLQISLKFLRPFIILKALFFLPLSGDYMTTLLYFSGVFFTGMIYGVDFRLRNPGSRLWLYRPLFTLLTTFVYSWLIFYAAVTIKKMTWR